MPNHLADLIRAVDDADSSSRLLDAVRNLAAVKMVEAVPSLIKVLGFNNPGAAVAAVEGIVLIGSSAVPDIMSQLDGHNYTARAWAIRALAGIGDPRGLVTLLGAATADFSVSVRRAATRGLGIMKWSWFPTDLREVAQEEALEALLFVAAQDEEWIVRYAAMVGLQSLFLAATKPEWQNRIRSQWEQSLQHDHSLSVRGRVWLALQSLPVSNLPGVVEEPPATIDWQDILDKLCIRKGIERRSVSQSDPAYYRTMAESILQSNTSIGTF